jgi:hypothetical protein
MVDVTTDRQNDRILQMIGMILDGCKDLNETKWGIDELWEEKKTKNKRLGKKSGLATALFLLLLQTSL